MAALARRQEPIAIRVSESPRAPARRGGGRKTKRRLRALRRRASSLSMGQKEQMLMLGAPVLMQILRKNGTLTLPVIANVNPNLLWGGVGAYLLPQVVKGEAGRLLAAAGMGLLTVGATECAQGGSILATATMRGTALEGDEDEVGADDDEIGDDEIGDDEIGDDEIGDDEIGDDED